MLNRPLSSDEVVHHIDENRSNNIPENLMVFRTLADHSAHHNGAELISHDDGTYSSRLLDRVCKCGNPKFCTASVCIECRNIQQSDHIPPKEELESLVWEIPMTKIAELYNVSDKAVGKWIKKYDLEKPPRGYFIRK
jgi:hypothetical protein